ncbi:MAG: PAS domain S-box protein [Archangium sp.]|nr:PAS domain S-box protein [Archangium sp.]
MSGGVWQLLDGAPDAMIVVSRDGRIVFANAMTEQVFGLTPSSLVGQPLDALLPAHARTNHATHVERYFANPRRRPMGAGLTLSGRKADGTDFPAEISLNLTAEGFVIAAIRDVTERQRASHRLATLGVLIGGVAHELNNPLAALISNVQELEHRKAELPPDLLEPLADAVSCSERLRSIAMDLRTFSRADNAPLGPVQLDTVVAAALRITGGGLRRKATLVQQLRPETWVKGHEGRLGQLVLNLLVNAEQALPSGPPEAHHVTVSVARNDDRSVLLSVADDGPGMANHVRDQLFTSFITTKPSGQGTGLGLSICKRIVTEHGGSIRVESEPGRGARFLITLPELT